MTASLRVGVSDRPQTTQFICSCRTRRRARARALSMLRRQSSQHTRWFWDSSRRHSGGCQRRIARPHASQRKRANPSSQRNSLRHRNATPCPTPPARAFFGGGRYPSEPPPRAALGGSRACGWIATVRGLRPALRQGKSPPGVQLSHGRDERPPLSGIRARERLVGRGDA